MSNNYNYESDILSLSQNFKRFRVSRIIDNPVNRLLELEVPSNIPDNFTIEVMLYTLDSNQLVSSTVIDSASDVLNTVTLNYSADEGTGFGSQRRLLFVDFSKLSIPLTQGRYELVLNFFVSEIGTFNEAALSVVTISPSRRELELRLTPQCGGLDYINKLKEFTAPQITRESILGALQQVFNQPDNNRLNLTTDNTALSYDIIEDYFTDTTKQRISASKILNSNYENILTQSIQTLQDRAYLFASESVRTSTTKIFTDSMIYDIVSSSLALAQKEITSEIVLL